MNIGSGYDQSFMEQVKRDFKEIENLPVSKLESLDDLKDTKGKSFKTADIEKLMEKYDPEAYEEYKQKAYTADGGHSRSGLSYLSKWMDKVKAGFSAESGSVKGSSDISAKNENKLSSKAQKFLKNLRQKYKDYDFLVGNGSDELKTLAKIGNKEFSVIFSNAEIERMASDEKYAAEKMQGVEGAVRMSKKICEENGFMSAFNPVKAGNGTINNIAIVTDDNGKMKLFAELENSNKNQNEIIEKNREKRAAEKKEAEKKASKNNPYEKNGFDSVKRTVLEADSIEELVEKIKNVDWSSIADSNSGEKLNYSF